MKNKWAVYLSVVYSTLGVIILFFGLVSLFSGNPSAEFMVVIGLISLVMGVLFAIYHQLEDALEILKSLKTKENNGGEQDGS